MRPPDIDEDFNVVLAWICALAAAVLVIGGWLS